MSSNSGANTERRWIVWLSVAASIATIIGTIIGYLAYTKSGSQPPQIPTPTVAVVSTQTVVVDTPTSPPVTATIADTPTSPPVVSTVVDILTPQSQPTQSPYGTTPTQTIDAFCTDLYNQDYQAAYTLFSNYLKSSMSEPTFANNYNMSKCGQNYGFSPYGSGQQVAIYIIYPARTYLCTYYLIEDSSSDWEIYGAKC